MKHVRHILTAGCIYTTAISLLVFIVAALIGNAEGMASRGALHIGAYLLILLFSFLIAGADTLLSVGRLPFPVRLLLHYAVVLTGFLVIFSVAGNLSLTSGAKVFVAVVLFTALYAAVMASVLSLMRALGKLGKPKGEQKPYRSMFR